MGYSRTRLRTCPSPRSAAPARTWREGTDAAKVHVVGNTMIDTLERLLPQARRGDALARLSLSAYCCGLVTLHRPSKVDDAAQLEAPVTTSRRIAEQMPFA